MTTPGARVRHDGGWGMRARSVVIAGGVLVGACAPAAKRLEGTPTRAVFPPTTLSARPTILRFTWSYKDETFEAKGDGAVRVQGPDRARLDFFLSNGMAGGYAILIGDSLHVPGIDLVKRVLPPVPLLWSSLGRLALPATPDTVARMRGDSLWADLGRLRGADASKADGRAWRVGFAGLQLARVERIESGRLVEWMSRGRTGDGPLQLQYVNEQGKRRLSIAVTDSSFVEKFDDAIWRRP